MKEVLEEFVSQLPAQVARIESQLAGESLEDLRRSVHQIKGAGGGYGFAVITQQAAAAEQRIKAQESLDQISHGINELVALIRRVEGYDPARERPVNPAA
jgi:HPt (histidine-containing phosphotransfer) domain-containing protein